MNPRITSSEPTGGAILSERSPSTDSDVFEGAGMLHTPTTVPLEGDIFKRDIFRWPNGDVYEGDFINGKMTGRGVLKWISGNIYEGDFIDGKRTGLGVLKWANGDVHEGCFVDGKRTGLGVLKLANGDVYDGCFIDGKITGRGVLKLVNGDTYDGDFVDGKITHGVLLTSRSKYTGPFVNKKPNGKGRLERIGQESYEGEVVNGIPLHEYEAFAQRTPAGRLRIEPPRRPRELDESSDDDKPTVPTREDTLAGGSIQIRNLIEEICRVDDSNRSPYLDNLFQLCELEGYTAANTIERIILLLLPGSPFSSELMSKVLGPLLEKNHLLRDVDPKIYVTLDDQLSQSYKSMYANTSQIAFAGWMHLMSLRAEEILKRYPRDSNLLFSQLGGMRYIQARSVGVDTGDISRDFGDLRTSALETSWNNQYSLFGKYLKDRIKNPGEVRKNRAISPNGEKLDATEICFEKEKWEHTKPANIPKIRTFFEDWTNKILSTHYENIEDLFEDLSNWYHTSVQGTFFFRGSSAITQAIFVALCRIKNIKPPVFIDLLDCWALSMTPEQFRTEIFKPWIKKQKIPLLVKYQGFENPNI